MIRPATLAWFARHEIRLVWRDWLYMMTAGNRRREPVLALAVLLFVGAAHLLAYYLIAPAAAAGIAPDLTTLVMVLGSAALSWTLMLSQAMESVTRAFYARADLDLILSSPAPAGRVFAIRIGAIAASTTLLATLLAAPFINALIFCDGPRWLAAYGVLAGMGAAATGLAVVVTVALFRTLGPKRTRLISQVLAAIVGASFVIGVQVAAILSYGAISRFSLLRSDGFLAMAPRLESPFWWPAHAAMGDPAALAVVLAAGMGLLAFVIKSHAARFGDYVIAASGLAFDVTDKKTPTFRFREASTKRALRRKEWTLLRRDPWLVSQTLMQILYLLPPALLLWVNFDDSVGTLTIMVPILVMASGQLAGGLAWLAVSGEDAPELVASAPISMRAILMAKIEAVLIAIAVVTAPLVIALAWAAPRLAIAAALGVLVAALSAIMVQIWFRAQAKRSNFSRRQISSRIATFAEAFASILWAGAAALAAMGTWLATIFGVLALCALGVTWMIRPRHADIA